MKSANKFFTTLVMGLCLSLTAQGADQTIKREVRSVWMATVYSLDWPSKTGTSSSIIATQKKQMTDYLDQLKSQNFNAIYFQVRSMCDAMYKSSYEPWSSYLTGTRGKDPGWDPLAFAVDECHKRGIECHAWVNPYRWAATASGWSTSQDTELKNSGILLSYTNSSSATTTILNPGLKATNERIVNVCREIATNYDVDGIIFDDYFYPSGIPTTTAAGDYDLWKNSGTSLSFADWRRANVNKMVADVYNMLQQTNPAIKFGISPAGAACTSASVAAKHGIDPCPVASDWQYAGIFSDPVAWLEEGTIDYISPQLYWRTTHSTNPFGPMTKWWSYVAKHFGRHHYASHSISALGKSNESSDWEDYGKQIQFSRDYTENDAPGVVLYSTAYINGSKASGLGNYLLANKFQHPSLTPAINWKDAFPHAKVTNLRQSNGRLTWDAVENARYSVYAIPDNISNSEAEGSASGGILADYLLGTSYTNTYTIASTYQSGYRFAVCVLDRFGNEFQPRYSNDESQTAPQTRLLFPNQGENILADFTLQWEKVDADSYLLEVSANKSFTDIVLSASSEWTEEADGIGYSVLVEDLSPAIYYWRVTTRKEGFEDAVSAIHSFTIATSVIEDGYFQKKEQVKYDIIDNLKLENCWIRSVRDDFQNIQYTQKGNLNRGFCVIDGVIYVSGRTSNSTTAKCHIDKYDARSGAYIGKLDLGTKVKAPQFPCNDVFRDDSGHLLVSNSVLKINSQPIKIFQVDKNTGDVTLICECKSQKLESGRVEYCTLRGDVSTGNFSVWCATSSGKNMVKWNFTNGICTSEETASLTEFTSSATTTGAAARLFPLNESQTVMNSSTTVSALYDFPSGTINSTFNNTSTAIPSLTKSIATNGFAAFTLKDNIYSVFPATDHTGEYGYTFNVVKTSKDLDFDNMELLWNIPEEGLGNVNSSTYNAQADYEINAKKDTARIYLFVPGNGLAAYRMTGFEPTGIIPVTKQEEKLEMIFFAQAVSLNTTADDIWIYTTKGELVSHYRNVSIVSLRSLNRGNYIVTAKKGKQRNSIKVHI